MRERSASGAETDPAAVVIAVKPVRCCSSAAASAGSAASRASSASRSAGSRRPSA
jgi:hypothetical protein